jgi:hypothetical protein
MNPLCFVLQYDSHNLYQNVGQVFYILPRAVKKFNLACKYRTPA